MTTDQWISLGAVWVPIIFGFVALVYQQRKQHKERIREQHAQVHADLLEAVAHLAAALMGHASEAEAQKSYAMAKARFSVTGSDEALRKLAKLDSLLAEVTSAEPKSDKAVALTALIRQARIDVLGDTKLDDATLFAATALHEDERIEVRRQLRNL